MCAAGGGNGGNVIQISTSTQLKRAKVFRSVDQVIPNVDSGGIITCSNPLIFDTVEWDTGGFFDPTKPDRFTIPEDGIYRVGYFIDIFQPTETFDGIYVYDLLIKNQVLNAPAILNNVIHEGQATLRVDFCVISGEFSCKLLKGDYIQQFPVGAFVGITLFAGYNDANFFEIEKIDIP